MDDDDDGDDNDDEDDFDEATEIDGDNKGRIWLLRKIVWNCLKYHRSLDTNDINSYLYVLYDLQEYYVLLFRFN